MMINRDLTRGWQVGDQLYSQIMSFGVIST